MAIATLEEQRTDAPELDDHQAPDTLAMGVAYMLVLTVIQRFVGFGRSIMFCRLMSDDQLGRWSLAFSFILMAAPMMVLGIPGSFGRYYEYYEQRGQGRSFLLRTSIVSGILATIGLSLLLAFPNSFSWLIFSDYESGQLVLSLAAVLVAVVAFNLLIEVFTSMRYVRVVSWMQLVNGLTFAAVGIGLLATTDWGVYAVVIACGASMGTAACLGVGCLVANPRMLPSDRSELNSRSMWMKLLPFAAWLWISDTLFNLFAAADQFMIVHFATGDGEALVGQYHSSRVIPVLMLALAGLFSGILLPYLSHEWEEGRKSRVAEMVKLAIKLCGILFTAVGLALMAVSPFLFGWLLRGEYDGGLEVLPLTVIYCIWFAMITLSQTYLLCAEKARLGSLALAFGLMANIALNAVLLPWLGLTGAVIATMAANMTALLLTQWFGRRYGMQYDRGLWVVVAAPILILLDLRIAALFSIVLTFWMYRGTTIFSASEKAKLAEVAGRLLARIRPQPTEQG